MYPAKSSSNKNLAVKPDGKEKGIDDPSNTNHVILVCSPSKGRGQESLYTATGCHWKERRIETLREKKNAAQTPSKWGEGLELIPPGFSISHFIS